MAKIKQKISQNLTGSVSRTVGNHAKPCLETKHLTNYQLPYNLPYIRKV